MRRNRPPSEQAIRVDLQLATEPAAWRRGSDLCRETGRQAGSKYPIFIGWLETKWETQNPPGRPPRHWYRLTGIGLQQAGELAAGQRVERPAKPPRIGAGLSVRALGCCLAVQRLQMVGT
jgi:hypothetical protein